MPQNYAVLGSSVLALLAISGQAPTAGLCVRSGKSGMGRTLRQEWRALCLFSMVEEQRGSDQMRQVSNEIWI